MILRSFAFVMLIGALAGCEKQTKMVYVLDGPQQVTLTTSASAQKVRQGESVQLHAELRANGNWKQIPMDQVTRGQCWVYHPPAEVEPEVADSVEWEVAPDGAVAFRPEFRLDHKRVITMDTRGTIRLRPKINVKCEPDRQVEGPPIVIEVT